MNGINLDTLSTEELRAELAARSTSGTGLDKTLARSKAIREPRPDLEDISSDKIFAKIIDNQKGNYGEDNRIESVDICNQVARNNAKAVASIFKVYDLFVNSDGSVSLPNKSLADEFKDNGVPLCSTEPFVNQPAGAICTAFLVRQDIVVTAGHCLNENNLHTRRFVFGYRVDNNGKAITTVPANDVYQGVEILGWELDSRGADWTVVRLDRKVEDRLPLKFRTGGKVEDDTSVYVIGHPIGLPQKYADDAQVRDNRKEEFFIANLDTYGGNSGSPVFNSKNHQVEGILVRGETDFETKENCMVSLVCPVQGCRGEDCTRITLATIPDDDNE